MQHPLTRTVPLTLPRKDHSGGTTMQRPTLALLMIGTLALASCGQQATTPAPDQTGSTPAAEKSVAEQISEFAKRPELQDADSQAILRDHANDPIMLDSLKRAYGQETSTPNDAALAAQETGFNQMDTLATGKAGYAQSVAWGSYAHYRSEKASPNYSGLNWSSDGCSAPKGMGLGYNDDFRPACDVHDFGYRNLPHLISIPYWPYNRLRTDMAFLRNMQTICAAKAWYKEPPCYAAATAYYTAVKNFGALKWHR